MTIGILDYGAGNLQSVRNALVNLGYDPAWIKTAADLEALRAEGASPPLPLSPSPALVFPGQGEFAACMDSLRERDLIDPLKQWIGDGHPYFGICLGYQVLFESSEEAPDHPGLGIYKGKVKRFTQEELQPQDKGAVVASRRDSTNTRDESESPANSSSGAQKIPHMGWNEIKPTHPADPLWSGLPERPHAYFVHSYYPAPADDNIVATTTTYGELTFASSIRQGHLTATQFHPEKSQEVGQLILRNYLEGLVAHSV